MVVGCNQRCYTLASTLLGINRMVDISYAIILVSEGGMPHKIEIQHNLLYDKVEHKGGAGDGKEHYCR